MRYLHHILFPFLLFLAVNCVYANAQQDTSYTSGNGTYNTFTLTTPFNYNGSDNLVVAVHKENYGYEGSSYVFRYTSGSSYKTLYYQSDGTACPAESPVSGTRTYMRNNIQFCFVTEDCPAPKTVAANNITTTTADITWRPGAVETEWEYVYAYAPMTDADLAAATPTAVTYPAVALSGLNIDADVYVYVRSKCDATSHSSWINGTFRTIETCSAPISLYGYSVADASMTMTVKKGANGTPTSYTYQYWMSGSTDTATVTGNDTVVVNNLEPGTYAWRAKATCQTTTPDGISRWTNGNNVSVCGTFTISDTKNYVQDFENIYNVGAACMEATEDYPYITTSSSSAHSGSKYLYFYKYSSDPARMISLPRYSGNEELYLSFYYKNYYSSSDYPQFAFGYQTANGTFYSVAAIDRKSSYTQARYSLNLLPDSAVNAAIAYTGGSYSSSGYIDDIRVAVQRNATIKDTLAGIDTRYNKNGFSISRSSMGTKSDTTMTRIATTGITDTLYTLNLHVCSLFKDTVRESICPGDSQFVFRGKVISNPRTGYYYDTVSVRGGTDTIHCLYLTVLPAARTINNTNSICQGNSYTWRGRTLTVAGDYYDTVRYAQGCDSAIFHLTLTVNPTYLFEDTATICQGSVYTWHNRDLTETGTYFDSLVTRSYCDSIYKLTLTVNPTYLITEEVTAQGSQVPYLWHGQSLKTSGVYYDTLQTAAGCDSIHILNLTVVKYPAVDSLKASDITSNSFHVSWQRNTYGTESRWRVEVKNTANDSVVFTVTNSSTMYCDVTGLDALTEYTVTVTPRPFSKVYGTPASVNVTTLDEPIVPETPVNVVASVSGARQLTFTWQNGSATQPDNYTYVVVESNTAVDPEDYEPTAENQAATQYVLDNASYASTYRIYVKNVVNGVSSQWADASVVSLPKYPAVDSLTVSDTTAHSFHVAWTRNTYGTESRWRVEVKKTSNDSVVFTVTNSSAMYCDVTGLDALTEYTVTVTPRPFSKVYGAPASVNVTTLAEPIVPETPVNVIAAVSGARQLTFTWQNGSATQPDNYTYVVVKSNTAVDPEDYEPTAENQAATQYVLDNASYASTYRIYVKNVMDGVSSQWADASVVSLPRYPAVDSLTVSDTTAHSFHVSWQRNTYGTESRWRVEVKKTSNDSVVFIAANSSVMYCDVTGLDALTEYTVTVTPRPYSKVYGAPASVNVTTLAEPIVPETPINVIATRTGKNITFRWQNGSTTQAANYTFVISAKRLSDPESATATQTGYTSESYDYTGTYGKTYYFYIKNVVENISSRWASETIALPRYPAVEGLTVSGETTNSFNLSWTKVGTETRWEVLVTGASNDTAFRTIAKATSCDVTGLEEATTYNVRVRPRIYSTTFGDSATTTATTLDEIKMPVDVIATRTGDKEITFSWANGSATQAANYTFIVSTKRISNPEAAEATETGYATNNYAFTGTKGKTYYFYIKNVVGNRSSEWASATITLPRYPAVDNLTISDTTAHSFRVAWQRNTYGTESRWRVEVKKTSNDSVVFTAANLSTQYCDVTGLDASTEYTVTVRPRIYSTTFGDAATETATTLPEYSAPAYNNDDNNGNNVDDNTDSYETIAEENLSNETFTPAVAYVNYDRLFVENIVAGSYVTIVDAAGKTIYNAKVNDSRFEYGLYVRGIYMVVIRDEKHNQTLKVVY